MIDGALKALNAPTYFPTSRRRWSGDSCTPEARGVQTPSPAADIRGDPDRAPARGQPRAISTSRWSSSCRITESAESTESAERTRPTGPPSTPAAPSTRRHSRSGSGRTRPRNFGFSRVERLAGNIGYLELRGFMPAHLAGETATAAMTVPASADAIIFDLRKNGGGRSAMVAFLTSYSVRARAFERFLYARDERDPSIVDAAIRRRQAAHGYGRLYPHQREHGLGRRGIHLQPQTSETCDRGRRDDRGGRTGQGRRINSRFMMACRKAGRSTRHGSNWEGVGVEPDVKMPAADALKAAHLIALEKRKTALPAECNLRTEIATTLESLRKELGPAAASIGTAPLPRCRPSPRRRPAKTSSPGPWPTGAPISEDPAGGSRTSTARSSVTGSTTISACHSKCRRRRRANSRWFGPERPRTIPALRDITLDGRLPFASDLVLPNHGARFSGAILEPQQDH